MALRKTQNVITHITQTGTAGTGAAHNANDIAFNDTVSSTGETNLQAVIDQLVTRITTLENPS